MNRFHRYCAVAIGLLAMGMAFGQLPNLPPGMVEHFRRQGGASTTYCVDETSLLADLDRRLSTELSSALLLEARIHEFRPFYPRVAFDYGLSITSDDIYLLLKNHCDALAGIFIAENQIEPWLRTTRPVFSSRFVLVSLAEKGYGRLEDIPRGRPIGVRLGGQADMAFGTFQRARQQSDRWLRLQYNENQLLLERVLDGTLEAALIWEPALRPLLDAAGVPSDAVRVIDPGAFSPPRVDYVFAVLAEDSFLLSMLDQGIEVLQENGTLDALLAELELGR